MWYGAPGRAVTPGGPADGGRSAVEAGAYGARCFVTAPNIFHLHGITAAMAVALLAHYLPDDATAAGARQLMAEHEELYRDVVPAGGASDGDPSTDAGEPARWDTAIELVVGESFDPHPVKLVEACRRGFEAIGSGAFVAAAHVVTN